MAPLEIGMGKSGRPAYGLDDIAIVPSRRTRDPHDVDISWEIDAFRFDLPFLAEPTDSIVSPDTAVAIGRLGGAAPLDLEGLWTRYEDPTPCLEEIAALDEAKATARIQELYAEAVKPELLAQRIAELRAAGVVACGAVSPQSAVDLATEVLAAELDLLVIRGDVVSAEHVSQRRQPLNLKTFIRELDIPVIVGGCASNQAALHLMRTGAAGVLVGVGAGEANTTGAVLGLGVAQATAIADVRAARMRHLDETGVYVHVIAHGAMSTGGDIAKAIVCGADAVMVGAPLAAAHDAPGGGCHWDPAAAHGALPRAERVAVGRHGSLEEVLVGPSHRADGALNLFGALRRSMATCGYDTLKAFQKAEVMVHGGVRS
mgnify:CR=1 FL=1